MNPSPLHTLLTVPFRTATWRRVAYALIALPASFVHPVWALRRLLGLQFGARSAAVPVPPGRRLLHAVVSLPLNAVTLVVTGYVLMGIVLNLAYPIRVEGAPEMLAHPLTPYDSLESAWGGPTLAGAWAVHAIGGVSLFGIAGAWLVTWLTWLQARLASALLLHQEKGGPSA